MSDSGFYDWERTCSYRADVTFVIAARDRGKTFGLRLRSLRRAISRGTRWVEVCRHKDEIPGVMQGYFDRLGALPEFDGLEFVAEGRRGKFRRKGETDDGDGTGKKGPWTVACYFCALTEAQKLKKQTYLNVDTIIMDEALVERVSPASRYLPREPQVLANLVDTVTREVPGVPHPAPHLYLLANSVDLVNPYFAQWGIDRAPERGYSWHAGHLVLLHYEEPTQTTARRAAETLAGRMMSGTAEGATALRNEFDAGDESTIARRPAEARFWFGIHYRGAAFGIWHERGDDLFFVDRKIPDGGKAFALTRRDGRVDRIQARRSTRALRALAEGWFAGQLRFDTPATREGLLDALRMFGVT